MAGALARPRRGGAGGLATAVVLGAALRFTALATQSFDGDELHTAWLVQQPLGDMLGSIPDSESTPYLYYVLAWAWARVFGGGTGGALLRSFSARAGVLTVPAAFALGRRLVGERAAAATAALVAASPLLVWFSQQARTYALFVLLAPLAAAAFAAALEDRDARAVRWWAALSALAVLTHYFAAFLVVPQAIWLARSRRTPWVALPLVALGALVPLAWAQ